MNQARVVLNGLIRRFYYFLGMGDEERAQGYRLLSEKAWNLYAGRTQKAGERLALPSHAELTRDMWQRIREGGEGFSEGMVRALESRLATQPPPP